MSEQNKDLPAYPLPIAASTDGCIYDTAQSSGGENIGLTKLEDFTKAAMQAIRSNPKCMAWNSATVASAALGDAIATLEALEKSK